MTLKITRRLVFILYFHQCFSHSCFLCGKTRVAQCTPASTTKAPASGLLLSLLTLVAHYFLFIGKGAARNQDNYLPTWPNQNSTWNAYMRSCGLLCSVCTVSTHLIFSRSTEPLRPFRFCETDGNSTMTLYLFLQSNIETLTMHQSGVSQPLWIQGKYLIGAQHSTK